MDDEQWIKHLQGSMTSAGWTPVGPDASGRGWIAGALRFEEGSTAGSGPSGFGMTPAKAVENLYEQVLGELPHRPGELREGESFEHEFDGIPDSDVSAIRVIRDDFHRHGYTLRWFHPMDTVWIMQWSPHEVPTAPVFGAAEEVGDYRGHDMTALEAAERAWSKFESLRGGG
jgi:hypothetical protein